MMARIRVLLRQRVGATSGECRHFPQCGLTLDSSSHKVTLQGEEIPLSRKEFALLQALVCHPGKLVQQTQLLIDIWGPSHKEDTHYLRIVIASLRKKLGDNPQQPADRDRIRHRLPLYRQLMFHVERRQPQHSASRPHPPSSSPRSCKLARNRQPQAEQQVVTSPNRAPALPATSR
jgi:hypothetical protein